MANITNAIIKATNDAGSKAITKGAQKAVGKATTKAIEKATTKALTKATEKAVNNALTKSITRGLTGAGVSSLAPKAGSTLDGVLGRSSGLTLPEPKITPKSLAKYTEEVLGEPLNSVGSVMNNMDYTLADMKADKALSRKNYEIVKNNAREAADIMNPVEEMNVLGVTSKSGLPTLNRQQYLEDTIGSLRLPDGSKNPYVSRRDVPDYMQSHLSNDTSVGNDRILRELFGDHDNALDMNELYDRYERIAQGANANEIYTPENIDMGIAMEGEKGDAITQDFADRVFGGKRDIPVSSSSSGAKNVKVSRPTADMGVEEAVAETPRATNPELANQIAELRAQIGSTGGSGAGMGNNGGGGTATQLPGSEGFNVKLKEGKTYNIQTSAKPSGATPKQRGLRGVEDSAAKALNANARQYRDLLARSKSVGDIYHSPAERAYVEGVTLNNVRDKTEAVLSRMEGLKNEALARAEANGVMIDLSGMDKLVGLSPTQKRKLAELGLDLDADILQGGRLITPTQAEEVYKTLRDYAYKWGDSSDPVTTLAGKAMKKEADAISRILDQKMNDLGFDFKVSYVNEMGRGGADLSDKYLRKIGDLPKFDFSDLRREEADWITIGKTMGNKPAKEPTLNVFGVDTGFKNPFTAGAEKIREKIYERQAYGPGGSGGAGGNMGGGSVPPTGGSGAENNINFETIAGGRAGTLGNLLGKAKTAGLVGAGVLGGMMLGGGGGGGSTGGSSDFANMYNPNMEDETEPEIDPYQTLTIGGYTYDQLENGYTAALMAGDSDAAKLIANMMGMLDDKIERYNNAKEKSSDSSGIASKQRAALNVLSGLMGNYQAQGPIGGRFTQFMNAITGGGYNPAVSAYDSGASGSLGTIIKALGDTGALSEGDQKRALELLPKTTDSEEAAKYKYQQLIQILQGAGAQ